MITEHPAAAVGKLRGDIAFVKGLIEDDVSLPPRDWAVMIAAGAIFGAMGIRAWLMSAGLWTAPAVWRPWMLLDAPALFVIVLLILTRRFPRGAKGTLGRTVSAAWSAVGVGVAAMSVAFGAASWKAGDIDVMGLFTPMLFVLYGMAWWIAYRVRLAPALKWVAIGSMATAGVTGLLVGQAELWLAEAVGLFAWVLVPGIVGLRASSRAGRA
ncbi:MAG: hypothetical protein ABW136_06085 [Steroidobacteraceae bacterium]